MALKIGDNFSYQGKQPNFSRDTFSELQEMVNFPETSLDEGHISLCLETGKRYIFFSTNSVDEVLGKWRLVVDTALDATSENPVQNKVIVQKFEELEQGTADSQDQLRQRVIDNELVTSASLNDLNDRLDEAEEVLSTAISEIKSSLDTDYIINGHSLGEKSILLTAEDIGLGKYAPYSDPLNLPVSNPTQLALSNKVDKEANMRLLTEDEASQIYQSTEHIYNTSNPHQVTKAQVGLGEYPDDPLELPVSTATQGELEKRLPREIKINGHVFWREVEGFITKDAEGYLSISISKSDVGLGSVDNTSDLNKPISTATQEALDEKVDKEEGKRLLTEEEAETIAGVEDTEKVVAEALIDLNKRLDTKVDKENGARLISREEIEKIDALANKEKVVAAALTDLDERISTVGSHVEDTNNPHQVTKAQVGLGNYPEDPTDLPISTTVQNALNNKVDKVSGSRLITEDEAEIIAGIENMEKTIAAALVDLDKRLSKPITNAMIDQIMTL